jgi:hypothetical protein
MSFSNSNKIILIVMIFSRNVNMTSAKHLISALYFNTGEVDLSGNKNGGIIFGHDNGRR